MKTLNRLEDGLIYVVDETNVGIYRFTDTAVSMPTKFNLSTAYPNHFNSIMTITYSRLTRSNITLPVYNTRGQLVEVLMDRVMPVGGIVWFGRLRKYVRECISFDWRLQVRCYQGKHCQ